MDGLGLEQLGVEISQRGIEVDERLRAAEDVWAIGDCTGVALFTHVGKYQARVAAANVAGGEATADYRAIPAVAFTDPQIATVGTTDGDGLVAARWDVESTPRASTYERPARHGFVKVVADPERRVLVGAVAVGPESGEWCQQLTLAVRAGGAGRRPARHDPAVPDLLGGRLLRAPGAAALMAVERIVVASDRSETATRAVAWAAEMAERYEAQLTIVQVFVPGPAAGGGRDRARRLRRAGRRARARAHASSPGEEPAAAIVAAAEAEKADVLVVGNIGMSGRREFLLGNVPNRVSHNARCTVVIVNTAEPESRRLPWRRT